MTATSIVAARVELLLTELRLPSVKAIWPKLAAQSDAPQSMPAGLLVTVPAPLPDSCAASVCVVAARPPSMIARRPADAP